MPAFRILLASVAASFAIAALAAPSGSPGGERCPVLATSRWTPIDPHDVSVLINRVDVGPGQELRWNGSLVTESVLHQYLALSATIQPRPVTLLRIGRRVDCGLLGRVAAMIEERGGCFQAGCSFGLSKADRSER